MTPYTPGDELSLWLAFQPAAPVLVGTLRAVRAPPGVSLTYAPTWLERGFSLSEDLPLIAQEFLPPLKDTAAGAVDDARPDRWGERVIRFIDRPARLALLDFLYFAGDDRFGALSVSTSPTQYVPRRLGPLPVLGDVPRLQELVRMVLEGERVPERDRRLISPGVTLGGARPKGLLELDGEPWLVKFSDGDPVDSPLIEHAAMTLAALAGIRVAATRPVRLVDGHAIAIQRFDRASRGARRIHALSAHVALRAAGEEPGYPELAQLLRRKGPPKLAADQMRELFRRMVFNILIDNTDDHEKNHVLLADDAGAYHLSPAFDVLPSGQALGLQQLKVGANGSESTLDNALSEAHLFGLTPQDAADDVRLVASVVARWRPHFQACGVTSSDVDLLAEQLDRPFLADQRRAAMRSLPGSVVAYRRR